MAKIPTFEQIGNATPNPSRGAAAVPNATAGIDAIGRLAGIGAEIAIKVDQNRKKLQVAQATTQAAKQIQEKLFEFENTDRDYSTQPQRFAEFTQELYKQNQKTLGGDNDLFNTFKSNVDDFVFKEGLKLKSNAITKDLEFQKGVVDQLLIDGAQVALRGDEELFLQSEENANLLIAQSQADGILTADEAFKARNKFKNELSRGKVRQDITADPFNALNKIRDNAYTGLSPEEQSIFEEKALVEIEQRKVKDDVYLKKQSAELVDNTILALQNDFSVTGDEIEAAKQAAQLVGKTNDLGVAILSRDYIKMPKGKRDEIYGNVQGVQNAEVKLAFKKADEIIEKKVSEDGYSFAIEQKLITPVEIDLTNRDSVKQRLDQADYLTQHYGQPVSPLTDKEADVLVESLQVMTSAEKANIAETLGPSTAVWSQLDKKDASTFAMVGAIGDRAIMKSVFKGQDMMKNGLAQNVEKSAYLDAFDSYVGGIYEGQDRKSMLEASLAHYVANNQDAAFDETAFQKSVDAISGGIGQINGGKVELPRGVPEDDFEDFIDYFSPKTVAEFGGINGMDDKAAAELIRDASIVNVGSNRYVAQVDGATLFNRKGEPFIITFDREKLERDKPKPYQSERGYYK